MAPDPSLAEENRPAGIQFDRKAEKGNQPAEQQCNYQEREENIEPSFSQ